MASYSEILFGRILLKNRLATFPQIQDCLRLAKGQTLGEVMIQKGMITPEQARQVQKAQALMQFMRAEKLFARILVERKLVDVATLRKAFEVQEKKRYKVRLAQILMERKLISAEQVDEVVDAQLMLLADETGRIEEEGLEAAMSDSRSTNSQIDALNALTKERAVENLDASAMNKALGPKGLLDGTPHIQRTVPVMVAPVVDAPPSRPPPSRPHKRTMLMESHTQRPQDAETEAERTIAAAPPNSGGGDLIGKTIASRYRILEQVGEGGMGTVYRAEHCLMEKIVALKILHHTLVSSSKTLDNFRREIRATSRFQHKNVIQIYDAGEGEGGLFYMAMEFAEGRMLEDVLQDGPLEQGRLIEILRQVLRAIGEAHKNTIVHRDMKSGNIILTRDKDGSELVKVMDFGIAKIALDDQDSNVGGLYKTQEGIVTGTPQYMSPEQASGEKVDHRSDLYSLGVILFEMLTGQLPFRSDTPMGFLGKHIVEPPPRPSSVTQRPIPTVLEEITLKLLEKKPEKRYQTASEVLADLDLKVSGDGLMAISSSGGGMRPPESWAPTIAAKPIPALARTIETPVSDAASLGVAPQKPLAAPPTSAGGGPNRTLIVALIALVLVIASISTAVAILSSQRSDPSPKIAQAKAALADDPQGAIALLQEVLAEDPAQPEALALMSEAEQAVATLKNQQDAARQVKEADDLVRRFDQEGGGRAVAEKAVHLYRMALALHPRPDVQSKLDALVKRLESLQRPDDRLLGKNLLLKVNGLLVQGKVAEAARQLRRAEGLLPAEDEALRAQQRHLKAEQLSAKANQAEQAGRLAEARDTLTQAIDLHPDRRAVSDLKRRRERVEAAIKRAGEQKSLQAHLADALEAAQALDIPKARAALGRAESAAEGLDASSNSAVMNRKTALAKLAAIAPAWSDERKELADMERSGGSPDAADQVRKKLREHRKVLGGLKVDVELAAAMGRVLDADLRRADALYERLKGKRDAAKSRELDDLLAKIKAFKAEADAVKTETYALADRLAQKAQDLQYDPALQKASKPIRAEVLGFLKRWRGRQRVWAELGKGMVQVAGGRWSSPSSKRKHRLPKVYYVLKIEVTCGMWRDYLRQNPGVRPPSELTGALSGAPIRNISLRDAERYCKWRNKETSHVEFRVPTEGEWERAARGGKGTEFPWGNKFESWMEASYANVEGGRPLRVSRTNTRDVNDWGLRDMAGNVREITRTRRDGKLVICGGSFVSGRKESGASAQILRALRDVASSDVGLRIIAVEKSR